MAGRLSKQDPNRKNAAVRADVRYQIFGGTRRSAYQPADFW